jgi:hypothetical protein
MAGKIPPWWENDMPAELLSAVEHLRTEFRGDHFKNGEVTRQICFEILHFQGPVELCRWRREGLSEVESQVGAEAIARFDSLLGCGTLSSVVAAFFDLYVEAMNARSLDIFRKLLTIADNNKQRINSPPVQWAKAQTNELFESKRHHIRRWVKDVCDVQWVPGQPLPMADDFFEWPSWVAPRFLIMEPLGDLGPVAQQEPFNSDTAQERLDAIDAKFTLRYFENRYTRKLRIALRHVAGEAAVYMAMHGVPPPAAATTTPEPAEPKSNPVKAMASRGQRDAIAAKRAELIRGVSEAGYKGAPYCKHIDERGVEPLPTWRDWPGSYAAAYRMNGPKGDKWRKRITDEKNRHSK